MGICASSEARLAAAAELLTGGASTMKMTFANNTGLANEDVYISFQRALGNTVTVTYGASNTAVKFPAGHVMSVPLSLKDIGVGGFQVGTVQSATVYVCYGSKLQSTTSAPSYAKSGESELDNSVQFQPFEITHPGQGNLTAINYFTAPMKMTSKDSSGATLDTKSYKYTSDQINTALKNICDKKKATVTKNGQVNGPVVRYLGPSTFKEFDLGGYQTFEKYLSDLHTMGQSSSISNSEAFNYPPSAGDGSNVEYTNFKFQLALNATVDDTKSINMKGEIVVVAQTFRRDSQGKYPPSGSPVVQTFPKCDVTLSGSAQEKLAYVIYAQADPTSQVTSYGKGWLDLEKFINHEKLDAQGVLNTLKAFALGEISSGVIGGFLGSNVKVGGVFIKDMDSSQWWSLNPTKAFRDAQPTKSYAYNQWADAIYNASGNEVYGVPYTDRFGRGPSMDLYDTVAELEVTLEKPVS